MVFDVHVKIGNAYHGQGKLIEEYAVEMNKNGIDRAVLCPNRPSNYSFGEGNEYVAQCIRKDPQRFVGAYRIDPWNWKESASAVEGYLKEGFQILYLNPWEDNYRCNDPVVTPVYEWAQEQGVPVLIETGYPFVSHISQVGAIAEQFPHVNFIVTNAGQLDLSGFSLSDVGYVMNMHPNIYMGTAAAVGAEWLANLVQNTARGRVLFESGYPFFDVYMEKFRIEKAYLKDEEVDGVMGKNAVALLK